jgi:group I intron endonuclease
MYSIYIIQNKITEKVYVGQTISGESRLRNHKYLLNKNIHKNQYLQNAWNSYGSNAFEFYILDSFNTKEEMDEAEIFYIKWYKDLSLSYNLTNGGEGGGTHSSESRIKMSESSKNRPPISEETRLKISLAKKNISEETRLKMSESKKDNKYNLGKTYSEETRIKMSISAKNRQKKIS